MALRDVVIGMGGMECKNLMNFEVFSNLNDWMILWKPQPCRGLGLKVRLQTRLRDWVPAGPAAQQEASGCRDILHFPPPPSPGMSAHQPVSAQRGSRS